MEGRGALGDHVADATTRLVQAGLVPDEATHSAEILARSVLGWSAADWLTHRSEPAQPDFPARFLSLVDRRARREPVAYILGEREFYGRPFRVTRDVLIPRPETELVVEESLRCLQRRRGVVSVVDVGTGSGCIAITVALEAPETRVVATDISKPALEVARENARRLRADNRVAFRHGAFLAGSTTPVDLIVSNPPYIRQTDRLALPPEVTDFEPASSLFAGSDGLDVIRPLVALATRALAPGGSLVLEIGQGQVDAVRTLIEATGTLSVAHIGTDLQAIPRVVVSVRQ